MANNKGDSLRLQFLEYIFFGTTFPWDANTDLYISLHTASPGSGGSQTTNETTYGDYARVAVNRTALEWNVTSNVATNINDIEFPENILGAPVITHVAIGTSLSGAGTILFQGALASSETVNVGNTPRIAAGTLTLTET